MMRKQVLAAPVELVSQIATSATRCVARRISRPAVALAAQGGTDAQQQRSTCAVLEAGLARCSPW